MELQSLIDLMYEEGDLYRISRNPFAQFGSELMRKSYLGANFFPERPMTDSDNNIIVEDEIRFRTIIAEDSGRYDPAVKRAMTDAVSIEVAMGHFDAKREINGRLYDTIIKMLKKANDGGARAKMVSMIDMMLNYALLDKKELQRWQMIIDSIVTVNKPNGQEYQVAIDAPTANRVTSPSFFNDNAFNPYEEITKGVNRLKDLGYDSIRAIISTYAPISAMRNNEMIQRRTGGMTVDTVNNAVYPVNNGLVTEAQINQILSQDGIPPITEYNGYYETEQGRRNFIPKDAMAIIANTGRMEDRLLDNGSQIIRYDTLGYYGVGRCQGETEVGDVIKLFPKNDKPVRIEGEAQGVGFPVLLESEAIYVIRGCVPA